MMAAKFFLFVFLLGNLSFFATAQDDDVQVVPLKRDGQQTVLNNSTVRGRVFYADTGRPVKRASLLLMPEDASRPGDFSALTDNQGYFQIKKVTAGSYYALVNAPGVVSPMAFADFSKLGPGRTAGGEKEAFQEGFKEFEKIVVNGINDLDVQIPARRGGAISGRVMYDDGDAAIGVKVEILRKVGDKFLSVIPNFSAIFSMLTGGGSFQTDDRGVYRFAGLPPGEYVIKVTENASHSESDVGRNNGFEAMLFGGNSFLTVFYPDAFEAKTAQLIAIEYGQEIGEMNLTIPSRNLFKMSGRVVSRKDKSPIKATVSLKRVEDGQTFSIFSELSRRQQGGQTDEQGEWSFKELPKGTYKITVEPINNRDEYDYDYPNANMNSSPTVSRSPQPAKPKYSKKTQEIVIEDQDSINITVELGFGGTVSGTVSVENLPNEMPRGVTIQASNETDELVSSASVGNYVYEGMPKPQKLNRDFKIENVSEGKTKFIVKINEDEYFVKSMTAGSTDLLTGEYEIKDGENLQNVKIVLGKGLGTLKGTVSNDDKEPVRGARLLIVPTDSVKRKNATFYTSAYTDEQGKFEAKPAPGEYAVIFYTEADANKPNAEFYKWLDEQIKNAPTVKIESGKTETMTIKQSK